MDAGCYHKIMKVLCICSALDIQYRFGCTPNWWQFLKGMYEEGHDVIAIPYLGHAFETPYWRCFPNPCAVEGQAFYRLKQQFGGKEPSSSEGLGGKISSALIANWIRPRWENHLADILEQEKNIDAVIFFTVPLNHLTGVPERLRTRYNVPFFYFDGDVPASLPAFGGFASGFKIYEGANLAEYDGFMCNSDGGVEELLRMGARKVQPVHWGVDPDLYAPLPMEETRDIFFYGFGAKFREDWLRAMITEPSQRLTSRTFAVGGRGFDMDLGRAEKIGDVPFNVFRQACCASRINLSVTRGAHASVFASSTLRPFELAAMGRCVVSSPYKGLETWFEIGRDMLRVDSPEEVIPVYEDLLSDDAARKAMGESARQTVLERHTHRHRAREIIQFISSV